MRLDKFVAEGLNCSRLKAKKLILSGQLLVDGKVSKKIGRKIADTENIEFSGKSLKKKEFRYIILNKPTGYICSTQDEQHPSALNLLNIENLSQLHFAGRLDQDTTGLVIISDDGKWTHRITSPKFKQAKTYRITLDTSLSPEAILSLESGVSLKDSEKLTKPASVRLFDSLNIELSIIEGRYHQVKRMIAAVGSHVISLHRTSIGHVTMDDDFGLGQWRYLTQSEKEKFETD